MKREPLPTAENRDGSHNPLWRSPTGLSLLLVFLTFFAFLRLGMCDFVNYDDPDYVTANLHVQRGLSWENFVWAFGSGHASNWHPLTWISHMLDWMFFGANAAGHHWVSLGFHILNALLVFACLRAMTGALWRSWLAAALFALHPLHVESVAWISERKDVLSMFFFLLCLWAYISYVRSQDRRRYLLALAFFAFGLMCKPMLVTVPFILFLIDYWPLMRFRSSSDSRFLILEKLPFLVLSASSCVVTFLVQRTGGSVSTSLSLGARLANALISYCRYLAKTFWPGDLSVLYPHPGSWPIWQVALAALFLAAMFVGAALLAKRFPYFPVGWLWFFGALIPVIGLVQVGIQSMADRYTYLPSVGLFMMLIWFGADLLSSRRVPPAISAVVSVVVLIGCFALTWNQVAYWRNSLTLFERAVRVTKNNYLAYNNIGFYLSAQGKTAESMDYYQKALKINPRYDDALNNMGYALAGQRRFAEALTYYEAALQVRPTQPDVNNNYGNALAELGRRDEAIEHYRLALRSNPEHADAHNNLGIALAMSGKLEEAIEHFQQAIRLKPGYASAHSNLGNAYAVQRKWKEAVAQYEETLFLEPSDPQAHNNLANVLAEQGQLESAVKHYQQSLAFVPGNPETHHNLALALLRLGQRDAAAFHLGEALRLKPDYAPARQQLDLLKKQ